jgi:thymidylate synthase ThyX
LMPTEQSMELQRRIYPLDPQEISAEELAVVFAMTSRRPEPFDQIQEIVTAEKAADFHERWVLGYGHASVAEHAVLHMAVENISRLACDTLEDNRLASYTEKSSRYQILEPGNYYIPAELASKTTLRKLFIQTCDLLFGTYKSLMSMTLKYLSQAEPRRDGEREGAYALRIRRRAVDSCRFVLPAATLTNLGVSMNARSMEHAIQKLLSSDLQEEQAIGQLLKDQGRRITPTLVRYADRNEYLIFTRSAREAYVSIKSPSSDNVGGDACIQTRLVSYDPQAQARMVAGLLYRHSGLSYKEVWEYVQEMSDADQEEVVHTALQHLGPHDTPLRELELVEYVLEFLMDYGAFREFQRHRMQTTIPQPLTTDLGFVMPPLLREAGLEDHFLEAMDTSATTYKRLAALSQHVAGYVATHAHRRRLVSKMNLRELYHMVKLRTQPNAHFTIQIAANQALELVHEVHPLLTHYIQLRTSNH